MTEATYKAGVLHQGLGLTFKIRIDAKAFAKLADDSPVECFSGKVSRKFIKSFLTLTDLP